MTLIIKQIFLVEIKLLGKNSNKKKKLCNYQIYKLGTKKKRILSDLNSKNNIFIKIAQYKISKFKSLNTF